MTCEDPICTTPCENGGICSAPDTCDCAGTGYTGATCTVPECVPACENGTCVGPADCLCDPGYDGDACELCAAGYQDNDSDGTCALACTAATCGTHGTCDDSSGTAACTCAAGWALPDCATCTNDPDLSLIHI